MRIRGPSVRAFPPASRILSCGYFPELPETGHGSPIQAVAASPLALPLAAESTDLVASNLGLFWFSDSGPVLGEIRRVLRPGGLIAFTTLGPGTLAELRRSWERVDVRSHIIDFIDMHDIGDAMVKAGFADVVMDAERISVTWPDVPALLRDLRGLGDRQPPPGPSSRAYHPPEAPGARGMPTKAGCRRAG